MIPAVVVIVALLFVTSLFFFSSFFFFLFPYSIAIEIAKLLLNFGSNINTHSNEFKESALTLACYKGHLRMVQYLLSAGMLDV